MKLDQIAFTPAGVAVDRQLQVNGQLLVLPAGSSASPITTELLEVQGGVTVGPAGGQIVQYLAPTGTGADTAAINNALAISPEVVLLPGTWGPLTAQITPGQFLNQVLRGCGWATQLSYDPSAVSPLIQPGAAGDRFTLRDLRITSTSAAANSGTGISLAGATDSLIERVLIDGTHPPQVCVAITGTGTYYNTVRKCRLNSGGTSPICVDIDSGANSNVVEDCRLITNSGGIGVNVNANGCVISHPDMETTGSIGVAVGASGVNVTIINPYIQNLTTGISLANGCGPVEVIGGDADGCATDISDSGCQKLFVVGFRGATGAFRSYVTGDAKTLGFGPKGGAEDAWIYRKAASTLQTDGSLNAGGNVRVGGLLIVNPALSALGSGTPVGIELKETTGPTANPSGGGVIYVDATGHLTYRGPGGTTTVLAGP